MGSSTPPHSTTRRPLAITWVVALALVGLGFARRWLLHHPTKPEFQISRVWWNADRPVHAVLFLASASYLYAGMPRAAGSLVMLDVLFSILNRL